MACNLSKDVGIGGAMFLGAFWEAGNLYYGADTVEHSIGDLAADLVGAGLGSMSYFMPCAEACERVYPEPAKK